MIRGYSTPGAAGIVRGLAAQSCKLLPVLLRIRRIAVLKKVACFLSSFVLDTLRFRPPDHARAPFPSNPHLTL
jgi:hypothetical protein